MSVTAHLLAITLAFSSSRLLADDPIERPVSLMTYRLSNSYEAVKLLQGGTGASIVMDQYQFSDHGLRLQNISGKIDRNEFALALRSGMIESINFARLEDLSLLTEHARSLQSVQEVLLIRCKVTDEDIETLASLPNLVTIDLSGSQGWTSSGLARLVSNNSLRRVTLFGTTDFSLFLAGAAKKNQLLELGIGSERLTAEQVKHITSMDRLAVLDLHTTLVRTEDFYDIHRLNNLKRLVLHHSRLTTDPKLASMIPASVERFVAVRQPVSSEFLADLKNQEKCKLLSVAFCPIDSSHIREIQRFRKVQFLSLQGTSLRGGDVAQLIEPLSELNSLEVHGVPLNSKDFQAIADSKSLRHLRLSDPDNLREELRLLNDSGLLGIRIQYCDFGSEKVTDVIRLPKLKSLWMDDSTVTSGSLVGLASYMPELKDVLLPQGVNATDFSEVTQLTHLKILGFHADSLNDEVLAELDRLTQESQLSMIAVDGKLTKQQKQSLVKFAQRNQSRLDISVD